MTWSLLTYDRCGVARYVSHLDTARALERTFARAGMAIALSAGMRPKPRVSLGLPLPVGAAATGEMLAVELAAEAPPPAVALRALRAAAPPGLVPTALSPLAGRPRLQPVEADYECTIEVSDDAAADALEWFAGEAHVPYERVSPKGRRAVDLKRSVTSARCAPAGGGTRLAFTVRHSSDGAARPHEFAGLIASRAGGTETMRDLTRTRVVYKEVPAAQPRATRS